jgi:hypothetical protein
MCCRHKRIDIVSKEGVEPLVIGHFAKCQNTLYFVQGKISRQEIFINIQQKDNGLKNLEKKRDQKMVSIRGKERVELNWTSTNQTSLPNNYLVKCFNFDVV